MVHTHVSRYLDVKQRTCTKLFLQQEMYIVKCCGDVFMLKKIDFHISLIVL